MSDVKSSNWLMIPKAMLDLTSEKLFKDLPGTNDDSLRKMYKSLLSKGYSLKSTSPLNKTHIMFLFEK